VQQCQIGTGQTEVRRGTQGQTASGRAKQQTWGGTHRRSIARVVEKEHCGRRSVTVIGRRHCRQKREKSRAGHHERNDGTKTSIRGRRQEDDHDGRWWRCGKGRSVTAAYVSGRFQN